MSTLRVDNITNEAGSGSPAFSSGLTVSSIAADTLTDQAGTGTPSFPNGVPVPSILAFRTSFISQNFNSSTSYYNPDAFDDNPGLNESGFSVTNSSITVPDGGLYFVSFNIFLVSGGSRVAPGVALGINGSVFEEIIAGHTYTRAADGHNESSANASGVVRLDSGDTLEVFTRRFADGGGIDSSAGRGSFNIIQVGV